MAKTEKKKEEKKEEVIPFKSCRELRWEKLTKAEKKLIKGD